MHPPLTRTQSFLLLPVCVAIASAAGCSTEPSPDDLKPSALSTQRISIPAALEITKQKAGTVCADLKLSNQLDVPIVGWSAVINLDGGTLTKSWHGDVVVSNGQLVVTAPAKDAVLAPGEKAKFKFCLESTRNIAPYVVEASAQSWNDLGSGYSATLALVSETSESYCAKVNVTNNSQETLWTWGVVVELNAASLIESSGADITVAGSRATARPKKNKAALAPGASTEFGWCATKLGTNYKPTLISPSVVTVKHLSVAVYLPQAITTCFIGEPCDPSQSGCTGLRDDSNVLVEGFTDASMEAIRTSSPRRGTAAKEICLDLRMSASERAQNLAELEAFRQNVRNWSNGTIELDLRLIEFDTLDLDESRWGAGVWVAPWNISEAVLPRLNFVPDFNIVLAPVRDPIRQLHHDIGGCGGTFGADIGILGAGWSWIPKTGASFGFECLEQSVITHEWLHQVHFAYNRISNIPDLYGSALPMCGQGDPDPRKWFPDTHQCHEDPDFEMCGSAYCGGNDLVNAHILSAHWDPTANFVANYCKNGLMDFDETAVDVGPSCRAP